MNWESSARVVLPDLSSSWTDEMLSWTSSVFWPLIVGLIFYLNRNREIKLTVIELSRKKNTRKPIFFPLLVGLLGGLLFGGMRWFLIKPSPDIFGLIYWSGMGFMWTSLGGLMDVLEFGEKDLSNIPNQGIWQLMKKPIFSGLLLTLFWGSFFGMQYLPDPKSVLIAVLAFGFTFGLLGGLAGGGFACIRHFALRFTLHYHNQIPWNLSGFLNSNVNRIILPKIGGGYKFFHPLLQEFFVEIDERELRSQF
jgi:hypothetical protein